MKTQKKTFFSVLYTTVPHILHILCCLGLDSDRKVAYPQSKKHLLRYSFPVRYLCQLSEIFFGFIQKFVSLM